MEGMLKWNLGFEDRPVTQCFVTQFTSLLLSKILSAPFSPNKPKERTLTWEL